MYDQMYDMTLQELIDTLNGRRQGLAYELWKGAYLTVLGVSDVLSSKRSSNFPKNPELASPELYPPRPKIKKPEWLRGDEIGRKV